MKKHNLWKTAGLIGIGYILKDHINKNRVSYKPNNNDFFKTCGNIIIDALVKNFDLDPSKYKKQRVISPLISKVSYDTKYPDLCNKKEFKLYEDIRFKTKSECKQFYDRITKKFNEQGGYITVLQYMTEAEEPTYPIQNHYGWYDLSSFKYYETLLGWRVHMAFPEILVTYED